MTKNHHILNAASNLLGITLLIIAGLHIANKYPRTIADKIAWIGAICFSGSCLLSYLSVRSRSNAELLENAADKVFLLGVGALLVSVLVLAAFNV